MPKGLMIAIGMPKRAGAGGKMPEPPEPIGGGKPKMEAEEPEEQPKPKAAGTVSPDAVSFRSAEEVCGNCGHMQKDGSCDLLGMEVTAGDSCNAFSEREGGMDDESGEMEPAEMGGHEGMRGEME